MNDDDKRLPRILAIVMISIAFAVFAAAKLGWLGPIAP
jgi:hypothetical protein